MTDFLTKANSGVMYLIAGIVIIFVMLMAAVFLFKAYREGVRIGMDKKKLNKVLSSSVVFSVVPSIGILIGVITLAGSLGIPLPWLRLSVIGALHYEVMAADMAAKATGMQELAASAMTGESFVTIAFVMTIGIIWGGLFCIIGLKRYQKKMSGVSQKDNRWGTIMFNAMFVGMVCAFIGAGFAGVTTGDFTSLVVIAVSAVFMWLFSLLARREHFKWLDSFSLSLSMIIGMASAICYAYITGGINGA